MKAGSRSPRQGNGKAVPTTPVQLQTAVQTQDAEAFVKHLCKELTRSWTLFLPGRGVSSEHPAHACLRAPSVLCQDHCPTLLTALPELRYSHQSSAAPTANRYRWLKLLGTLTNCGHNSVFTEAVRRYCEHICFTNEEDGAPRGHRDLSRIM